MLPDSILPKPEDPVAGKHYRIRGTGRVVKIVRIYDDGDCLLETANKVIQFKAYDVECFSNGTIKYKEV